MLLLPVTIEASYKHCVDWTHSIEIYRLFVYLYNDITHLLQHVSHVQRIILQRDMTCEELGQRTMFTPQLTASNETVLRV